MSGTRSLVVGVLGGMGPAATLDLLVKIHAATDARSDQDHLHLLVDCNPGVPDRNAALAGRGPTAGPVLVAMARRLEAAGADFLVMACNTAHAYEAEIRAAVRIPFVSMIEETVARVAQLVPPGTPCGVLAAPGCLRARLYERALETVARTAVLPDAAEQARFAELLYRIKAGERGRAVSEAMVELAGRLEARGARLVIAGCTEVPLVLAGEACPVPLVDSSAVLAEAVVAYARARRPLPPAGHAPTSEPDRAPSDPPGPVGPAPPRPDAP